MEEGLNTRTRRFIYLYNYLYTMIHVVKKGLTKEMVTPLLLPLPYMYMWTTFV